MDKAPLISLTVNTPYASDLAKFLKKEEVQIRDLQLGDIVCGSQGIWQVGEVRLEARTCEVLDAKLNTMMTSDEDSLTVVIIARSCLLPLDLWAEEVKRIIAKYCSPKDIKEATDELFRLFSLANAPRPRGYWDTDNNPELEPKNCDDQ